MSTDQAPIEETDSRLLERVRASDVEAFRLLFEKYQPVLFRGILQSLRDTDAAHDIIQETFLRVWIHRASLKPEQLFLAYVFKISRNLIRDHAKHQQVRKTHESEVHQGSPSPQHDPEGSAQLNMLEERISEVVRTKLPAKCREVFLLSRMEQMSNAEIGIQLGITAKTVENQITRAIRILRRNLRKYMNGD